MGEKREDEKWASDFDSWGGSKKGKQETKKAPAVEPPLDFKKKIIDFDEEAAIRRKVCSHSERDQKMVDDRADSLFKEADMAPSLSPKKPVVSEQKAVVANPDGKKEEKTAGWDDLNINIA